MSAKPNRPSLPGKGRARQTEALPERLRARSALHGLAKAYLLVVLPRRFDDYAAPSRPLGGLVDFIADERALCRAGGRHT